MPEGRPADFDPLHLDAQLCFAVYSAAHAYNRLYRPLLDRLRLTYPQYLVMLVLWETDGPTVKALGKRLLLDSGTLTPLLKRLEAAGLLVRERSVADERQVLIRLTEAGRALKAEAASIPSVIGGAFGGSETDARLLKETLIDLRDRLNSGPSKPGG
jgi:DNA-binding MarR family transcriptional regulator